MVERAMTCMERERARDVGGVDMLKLHGSAGRSLTSDFLLKL